MTRLSPTRRSGFSLIEMVVVVAIILILLALLTPALSGALESARDVGCRNNLRHIVAAMDAWSEANDGYLVNAERTVLWDHGWEDSDGWATILVNDGFLHLEARSEVGSAQNEWAPSQAAVPRRRTVFRCPNDIPRDVWDSVSRYGAPSGWMNNPDYRTSEYAAYVTPWTTTSTDEPYVLHTSYTPNASTWSNDWPFRRHHNPATHNDHRTHMSRLTDPSLLVAAMDGVWLHNRFRGRASFRHHRYTRCNFGFFDGSVRSMEHQEFSALGDRVLERRGPPISFKWP